MVHYELMRPEHIPEVARIEESSFAAPWTELMFYVDIASPDNSHYYIAVEDGNILGYIGMHAAPLEAHITTFAVRPECRQQGVGKGLLAYLIAEAQRLGIDDISLEVRVSNSAARRLYEAFGFVESEVHENYYIDNHEDAVILWAHDIGSKAFRDNVERVIGRPT